MACGSISAFVAVVESLIAACSLPSANLSVNSISRMSVDTVHIDTAMRQQPLGNKMPNSLQDWPQTGRLEIVIPQQPFPDNMPNPLTNPGQNLRIEVLPKNPKPHKLP